MIGENVLRNAFGAKLQTNAEMQFSVAKKIFSESEKEENAIFAFRLYSDIAKRGHHGAEFMTGYMLQTGIAGKVNFKKGTRYLKRASNGNNADAILLLARNYYYGAGAERKVKKAFRLWQKGAKQFNAECEYYVGLCYLKGEGVRENRKKAKEFFERALKHGFLKAESMLCQLKSTL